VGLTTYLTGFPALPEGRAARPTAKAATKTTIVSRTNMRSYHIEHMFGLSRGNYPIEGEGNVRRPL